jgi:hypothetical protein
MKRNGSKVGILSMLMTGISMADRGCCARPARRRPQTGVRTGSGLVRTDAVWVVSSSGSAGETVGQAKGVRGDMCAGGLRADEHGGGADADHGEHHEDEGGAVGVGSDMVGAGEGVERAREPVGGAVGEAQA